MRQLTDEQIQDLIDKYAAIEDGSEALTADATSTTVYLEGVLAASAPTEHQLARLAGRATGSDRARTHFAQVAQRLLLALAVEFESPQVPLLDLVQEGNMALLAALGEGESDLAALQDAARGAMAAFAAEAPGDDAKIPAHLAEVVGEYVAVHQHLVEELGREPSDGQMAEHMDQPVELIEEAKAFLEGLA